MDTSAAFLFADFIQWFKEDPLAKTIRYFVMTGDGVDGVGIYPGQERHLSIKDLFKQYSELARMLEQLPDWVDCIILPGNHDAVRPAEPQPALDPDVQQDYSGATFAGNPSDFSIHGVRILAYHGVSISDFVSSLRSVSFDHPERAMMAMLERRHLAPSCFNLSSHRAMWIHFEPNSITCVNYSSVCMRVCHSLCAPQGP